MLCYNTLPARQQVIDIGSQVCPYTNFCHTDASKIIPNDTDNVPCCFPCFCDEECWEFDNCCPDKHLIATTRPQVVPCIDSLLRSQPTSSLYYAGEFYRVIDTCPFSENRWNLEPKCNTQNITSLEDFVWVSDKTGKIYKNIHCAKCHGIKEPITWQVQTKTCFDIRVAKFDNLMEALLLSESCSIKNTPPEDLRRFTDKYACIDPRVVKYHTCNESGLMKSYDPAIEIACEQSTWPYFLDTITIAKNMFCLLCNQELPEVRFDLCFFYDGGKDGGAFTYFIDYTSLQSATTEEGHDCGLDEMFDEFLVKNV